MLKERNLNQITYRKNETLSKTIHQKTYYESTVNEFTEYKIPIRTYNRGMNRIIQRFLKEKTKEYDTIVIDQDILQGMPVIKGTRLPVTLILAYLRDEGNFEEILEDFPYVTAKQVADALDYVIKVIGDPYKDE